MKPCKTVGIALSLLLATAVSGCGGSEPPPASDPLPERELPEIAYTVDESLPGTTDANAETFYAKNVAKTDSPLAGKTIYWLGSSVTYGANSGGESMADFLAAKTGCISKKDAVSGTTIFDDGKSENTGAKSYTRRLKESTVFDKNEKVDAFICQISTNDAWGDRKKNWGEITPNDMGQQEDFDLSTTLGGIEFIIAYVTDTWGCPVYFYSGAQFFDKSKTLSPAPTITPRARTTGNSSKTSKKSRKSGGNFSSTCRSLICSTTQISTPPFPTAITHGRWRTPFTRGERVILNGGPPTSNGFCSYRSICIEKTAVRMLAGGNSFIKLILR